MATRWRGLGKMLTEGAACPLTEAEADYVVWDMVRSRVRMIYMLIGTRAYDEGGATTNWGVCQYSVTAGLGAALNSDRMGTMGYLVSEFAKRGIRCMMVNNSYREWWLRDQYPNGTYFGHGLLWLSAVARARWKANFGQVLAYTNPHTGRAFAEEPNCIWKIANEDGLLDAMLMHGTSTFGGGRVAGSPQDTTSTTHWTDQITTSLGANGNQFYTAEVNDVWDDAAALVGWSPPYGSGFPTRAQCTAMSSGSADRINLMKTIATIEKASGQELLDWARSFNPDMVVGLGEQSYFAAPQLWMAPPGSPGPKTFHSTHMYLPAWDGTRTANDTDYPQRGSSFAATWGFNHMNDGGPWSYSLGGLRSASVPAIATECGQYGESRWNYDVTFANALFAALQDFDGVLMYQGAQQRAQYLGTPGTAASEHVATLRPAHRLALRCLAPIFEHGWMHALPTSHTTQVTDTDIATAYATSTAPSAGVGYSAVRYHSAFPSSGGEKAFLKKVLYFEWHPTTTALDDGNFPTLSDATYNAATHASPIVLKQNADTSTALAVSPQGIVFNIKDRCYGWCNNVQPATTLGRLTTSGSGTFDTFVLIWRSESDAEIGTVNSRLFHFGFDYPTGASAFSTTTDGTTGLGADRGDLDEVVLFDPPSAITVSLQVDTNQDVFALNAEHEVVAKIASTFSGSPLRLTFTLDAAYPEYLLIPRP